MFGYNPTNHNLSKIGLKQAKKLSKRDISSSELPDKKKGEDLVNNVGRVCNAIINSDCLKYMTSEVLKEMLSEIIQRSKIIEVKRAELTVETCSNLGVDLNKFQFGIVFKRFIDYLKNIELLMQETDEKTIRIQSGLYEISMKKVINQLIGVSVDKRVLQRHKYNSNEEPEKFIRAKELIDEVEALYMNVGHFFRKLLSMLPEFASSEIEEPTLAPRCR